MSEIQALSLEDRLAAALAAREALLDKNYQEPARLFNGFYEGCPELVADLYAGSLVLFGYAAAEDANASRMAQAQAFYLERLPGIRCVIHKNRSAPERGGKVAWGGPPDQQAREQGIWYALDLLMNQDASFYLDTRGLRDWLLANAGGQHVLNLFAYTGSLGVAALCGGAAQVVQVDRSRKFLALARRSAALNQADLGKMKLVAADFFDQVAAYKRSGRRFGIVIVDPPFFSATEKGVVDQAAASERVINKVRPLVEDGGWLVVVNNALFLSGANYWHSLERICQDGYLAVQARLPVPADITGFPETICTAAPVDPAPYNHSTKITLLRVRRKGI